jgi:hypothetical protein
MLVLRDSGGRGIRMQGLLDERPDGDCGTGVRKGRPYDRATKCLSAPSRRH